MHTAKAKKLVSSFKAPIPLLVFCTNLQRFSDINQPGDGAPDLVHPDITTILDLKNKNGSWQCHYIMHSVNAMYDDLIGWECLELLFADIDDYGPSNLLVCYINEKKKKAHKGAAKWIAERMDVPLTELFPFLAEQRTKKTKNQNETIEEIPKTSPLCFHSMYDVCSYDPVDIKHFFLDERKYSEAKCLVCSKWFATPKNKTAGRSGVIPLPSSNSPVYVCTPFNAGHCACGAIVCNTCFVQEQLKEQGSSRRSARSNRRH